MKLTSILRTTAFALALVAAATSSGLGAVDATRIKARPYRVVKTPCPATTAAAATAALATTAAAAGTVTAYAPQAAPVSAVPVAAPAPVAGPVPSANGPATNAALPTTVVVPSAAVVPTPAAVAVTAASAPQKQSEVAVPAATLVPGPIAPTPPSAANKPPTPATEIITVAPATSTIAPTPTPTVADTGKVTVIPIGNNIVTVGFKDGASVITDGQIVTATVSLNVANRANPPPSVELIMPAGLVCARTSFTFNPKDPSTFEQAVTCRTDAGSTASSTGLGRVVDLSLGFRFPDVQPPLKAQQQIIKRTVIPAARCSVHGDPHVISLDGRTYDFMEQGVFRMFKSRSLQLQVFLENCDPKIKTKSVTCTRGVAIAFGSSVARLFVADGRIQVAKGTASAADWLAIERLGGNTDAYRVFLNADHAAFVDVTLQPWAAVPYIDVVLQASALVRASEAEGGVSGMCGNWNGNGADDDTKTQDVIAMHATSTSQNLFTCTNDACAAFTGAATPHDEMAKTIRDVAATTALHQSYTPLSSDAVLLRAFDTTRVAAMAAVAVPVRKLRGAADDVQTGATAATATATGATVTLETATAVCERVLITGIPQCAKYVSPTTQRQYVDSVCAADAVVLNDLAVMVDSAKLSYLRECRREMDTRLVGVKPTESRDAADVDVDVDASVQALQSDRAALLFGELSQCESNCSGRGECLSSGCQCVRGFSGLACEIQV